MKKKFYHAIFTVSCFFSCQAAISGPFIGFSEGFSNTTLNAFAQFPKDKYFIKTNSSANGFTEAFSFGYILDKKNLSLKADVYALYAGGKNVIEKTSSLSQSTSTLRYAYGIEIAPGHKITQDVITYGILGYQRSFFNFQRSDPSHANQSFNDSPSLNGLVLGLGASISLSKNWKLILDYRHINSQSYTAHPSNMLIKKFSPITNIFQIGFTFS